MCVNNLWENIRSDTLIKSFKTCGISMAMNGTEDNILFDQNTGSNDKMSNSFPSRKQQGFHRF